MICLGGTITRNIEAKMLGESSRYSQQKQLFLAWTRDCSVSSMTSWLLRDKHLSKDLMFGMGGPWEENARGSGLPAPGEPLEP